MPHKFDPKNIERLDDLERAQQMGMRPMMQQMKERMRERMQKMRERMHRMMAPRADLEEILVKHLELLERVLTEKLARIEK